MKYLFITIEEQNREYFYHQHLLKRVHESDNIEKKANDTVRLGWYPDETGEEFVTENSPYNSYEFFGGEICVRVTSCKEISKEEYKILDKYI